MIIIICSVLVVIVSSSSRYYPSADAFTPPSTTPWRTSLSTPLISDYNVKVSSSSSIVSVRTSIVNNRNRIIHGRKQQQQQQQQQQQLFSSPKTTIITDDDDGIANEDDGSSSYSFSYQYVEFAKDRPFVNNILIATAKTGLADFIAQTVIAQVPLMEVDLQRSFLFCIFGALYSGAFQYLYQVQVFKRLFDVDKFTSQPWGEKIKDVPGIKNLLAQTGLDLTILSLVYLSAFYVFKASVFSEQGTDPSEWFTTGIDNYLTNFHKDESDLVKVWLPADLVCFSVALYLRMPVRQLVSFGWTAYLSFAHGSH